MESKQTHTPGATLSKINDDFRRIKGIGPVVARRLHEAGIYTYDELASLSPVKLAARFPGLSVGQIVRQDWIGQARKLSSKKAKSKTHQKAAALPANRQHYENFTIEFLLDEKKEARRTRIVHIQSGDAESWTGWEAAKLNDFLLRYTGLNIPQAKLISQKSEPAQMDNLQISNNVSGRKAVTITTSLPALPTVMKLENSDPRAGASVFKSTETKEYTAPLRLRNLMATLPDSDIPILFLRQGQPFFVQLTIDYGKVIISGKAPPTYKATIVYKQVGGSCEFLEETSNILGPSDSTSLKIAGPKLTVGIYRLSTLVKIGCDDEVPGPTAYQKGDLLEVY